MMEGQLTVVQGRSGSGKTRLITAACPREETLFLTTESVLDYLLGRKGWDGITARTVVVEDVDLFRGKSATQRALWYFVLEQLYASRNVVLSGIDLSGRVPLLFSLCVAWKAHMVDL